MSIRKLYQAQNGECFHCGGKLSVWPEDTNKQPRNGWTRDHLWPKSKIKAQLTKSIVLSCGPCNRSKGNSLPTKLDIRKLVSIYVRIK